MMRLSLSSSLIHGVLGETIKRKRGYARSGEWSIARQIFDEMSVKDLVSWNVMITWYASQIGYYQLAISKETGRRLGVGTKMYPSSSLLGGDKDEAVLALIIDELIEKSDGFTGVFPEHKYDIVKRLQARKHICGMTGDGVNDEPALKVADIGIGVADATNAAQSASDIVLIEPRLSAIISVVYTSRAIS